MSATTAPDRLELAVADVLGAGAVVVERRGHPYASSFPGDVLVCRLGDGSEHVVLCKREAGRRFPRFGHRGGPGYEAVAYREVVQRSGLPAAGFLGAWRDPAGGDTWLLIEYIAGAQRLSESADPAGAMRAAARWAGRLHAISAEWAPAPPLKAYDAEYLAGWARRTAAFAGERHSQYPWLASLCARAKDALAELIRSPAVVIHGEYTPHNVLLRDAEVLPVDWETAAIAAGEIDLASLTERWPAEVVAACEAQYVAARWPDGAPAAFARTLDLARLYWSLRWLGDRREWLSQPRMAERYEALRATGERLGLT